jgi:outer membrane lipoprotein-sorting protein
MKRAGFILAIVASVFAVQEIFAADTNAVLNGWFAAQKNMRTWSADLVQTRTLKTLTQPLTASGHISATVAGKFRWEILRPGQTIAVGDAEKMYVVYPRLKRAELYPMGASAPKEWREAMALLQAGMPHDRKEFETQFQVLSLAETNGGWRFALQPRNPATRKLVTQLTLCLATNDYMLTATELVFVDGSRLRNDFTNAVLNGTLDETGFDWQPPADFKVAAPFAR